MRIGVFSDSHGDISFAKRFFDRLSPLDCILHLGDYASDGEKLSKLFGEESGRRRTGPLLMPPEARVEQGIAPLPA